MRVLIDTNVLISAALSANGVPYQAYVKAASYPNHGLICEQNVDEIIPTYENMSESQVRDADDRPILRAAIAAKADVLLTGDKDFLESGLKNPKIMTPAEFLDMD